MHFEVLCCQLYRLENWNFFLAPGRPYFFRSTIRASRVRKPLAFKAGRFVLSSSASARAMPCRAAPACPLIPPPRTLMRIFSFPSFEVIMRGCLTCFLRASVLKKSSKFLPLALMPGAPSRTYTLATEVFRRPVPLESTLTTATPKAPRFRVSVPGEDVPYQHIS